MITRSLYIFGGSVIIELLLFFVVVRGVPLHQAAPDHPIISVQLQKKSRILSTPERRHRVLAKYNVASPVTSPKWVSRSVGSVHLMSVNVDVEYVGLLQIGTPPQTFQADFDTGSSDIWIPSKNCTLCGNHPTFFQSNSSTFKPFTINTEPPISSNNDTSSNNKNANNGTWTLQYGDGSAVQGTKGYDHITVGNLTVKHQLFGLANKVSTQFATDSDLDGIFGLGFPKLSLMGAKKSFVENLKDQGIIKNAIASFYLGQSEQGGQLSIGSIDPNLHEGNFTYIDVTDDRYWEIPFNGIKIGDRTIMSGGGGANVGSHNSSMTAIIDTGTTLIVVPPSMSEAIHMSIPGAEYNSTLGWQVPCTQNIHQAGNNSSQFSDDIIFRLGEHEFPIPYKDLIREKTNPENDTLCYSGIAEAPIPIIIMGDTFLRSYYSVFDYDNKRVGFSKSK